MTTPPFSSFALRNTLLIMSLMLAPLLSHADTWDIDQLMHSLAQVRSDHARFSERKNIAMLEAPVESSGELFYTAPDQLEKRTLKPVAETLLLNRDKLTIERGHKKHQLQLQDYPELAAFIDSIRGTLAGDRKALERNYRLSLEGNVERWTLQLLPLNEKIQTVITRILIAGRGVSLRSIEITQTDGDSSIMFIDQLTTP